MIGWPIGYGTVFRDADFSKAMHIIRLILTKA